MLCPLLFYTSTGHRLETRSNFIAQWPFKEEIVKKNKNKKGKTSRTLEAEDVNLECILHPNITFNNIHT